MKALIWRYCNLSTWRWGLNWQLATLKISLKFYFSWMSKPVKSKNRLYIYRWLNQCNCNYFKKRVSNSVIFYGLEFISLTFTILISLSISRREACSPRVYSYCVSRKRWPILFSKSLHKMGHYFLDTQYYYMSKK